MSRQPAGTISFSHFQPSARSRSSSGAQHNLRTTVLTRGDNHDTDWTKKTKTSRRRLSSFLLDRRVTSFLTYFFFSSFFLVSHCDRVRTRPVMAPLSAISDATFTATRHAPTKAHFLLGKHHCRSSHGKRNNTAGVRSVQSRSNRPHARRSKGSHVPHDHHHDDRWQNYQTRLQRFTNLKTARRR